MINNNNNQIKDQPLWYWELDGLLIPFDKLIQSSDYRVVVVSRVNHFVFTPMLASAAVRTVKYRSMTEPIRGDQFQY